MAKIKATKPKDLSVGDMVVLDEQVWDVEAIEPGNVYTLQLTKHGGDEGRIFRLGCRASIGTTTSAKGLTPAPEASVAEETAPDAPESNKPTKAQAGRDRLAFLADTTQKVLVHLACIETDIVPKVEKSKRFELQDAFVGPFSPEVVRIRDTEKSGVFMLYTFKKDPRMVSIPRNAHQALRDLMGDRWCYENFHTPSDAYKERVKLRQEAAKAEVAAKKDAKETARKEVQEK